MPIVVSARKAWSDTTSSFCAGAEAQELCDVIFQCESGKRVYAMKGMLAMHSPVLRTELFGQMREGELIRAGEVLTIDVPWQYQSLKALVVFCHTGTMRVDNATIIEILYMADYYGMMFLLNQLIELIIKEDIPTRNMISRDNSLSSRVNFDHVEDFDVEIYEPNQAELSDNDAVFLESPLVNRGNVLGVLECACRSRSTKLRDHCLGILEPDMAPAVLSEDVGILQAKSTETNAEQISCLGSLSIDALCTMLVRDELCMEEIDVFRSVLRWGRAQVGNVDHIQIDGQNVNTLKQVIQRPMKLVRFSQIPPKLLIGEVQASGFIDASLIIEALAFQADPDTAIKEVMSPNQPRSSTSHHPVDGSQCGWGDEDDVLKNELFKFKPRMKPLSSQAIWSQGVLRVSQGPFGLIDYHRFTFNQNDNRGESQGSGGGGNAVGSGGTNLLTINSTTAVDRTSSAALLQGTAPPPQSIIDLRNRIIRTSFQTIPRLTASSVLTDVSRRASVTSATPGGSGGGGGAGGMSSPDNTPWLQRLLKPSAPHRMPTSSSSVPAVAPSTGQAQASTQTTSAQTSRPSLDSATPIPSGQLISMLRDSGVTVKYASASADDDQTTRSSLQPRSLANNRVQVSMTTEGTLARLEQLEAEFDRAIGSSLTTTKNGSSKNGAKNNT